MTLETVKDLDVDENFNVFIDHRGDLAGASGRGAFELHLRYRLTEALRPLIGKPEVGLETIKELAHSKAQQVAAEMDQLDNLATFEAGGVEGRVGVIGIRLVYDTGDVLEFEVEG